MEDETPPPNMGDLTLELADVIFAHIADSPRDIANAMLVCKRWRECILESDVIWREMLVQRWPHTGRHVPDPLPQGYDEYMSTDATECIRNDRWKDACLELGRAEAEVRWHLAAVAASATQEEWDHRLVKFQDNFTNFYAVHLHLERFRRLEGGEPCGLAYAAEVLQEQAVAQMVSRLMADGANEDRDGDLSHHWSSLDCRMELVALFIALMVQIGPVRRGTDDKPSPVAWVPLAVDKLAQECRQRLGDAEFDDKTALSVVIEVLFGPQGLEEGPPLHPLVTELRCPLPAYGLGLRGCSLDHFEDPSSSCLDQVLLRRRGLPITLCLLHCMVARRLGLNVVPLNTPEKVYNLALSTNSDGQWSGKIIDCFQGGRIVPWGTGSLDLGDHDAHTVARRLGMNSAALGMRMLRNLISILPRHHSEVQCRLAMVFKELDTRYAAIDVSGFHVWYTYCLEQSYFSFPDDLGPRIMARDPSLPKIGQVVEWEAFGSAQPYLGIVLEYLPVDFIIPDEDPPLSVKMQNKHLHSFILNLGNRRLDDVEALRREIQWDREIHPNSAPSKFCIVLALDPSDTSLRNSHLRFPSGVEFRCAEDMKPAVLPAADTLDDPEEAEKVRALERECGRYFLRRSSDGRGFLPNAATLARFGPDMCFSE